MYNTLLKTKSGRDLHPIGIGTWGIANSYKPEIGMLPDENSQEAREIEALQYSLSKGQNHIDTAEMYGGTFTDYIVGKAIAAYEREDIFIADKLWKSSLDKGAVRPAVMAMLQKLDTEYIDLLHIHSNWSDPPWQSAVPQIDELINEGLVRQFGSAIFPWRKSKKLPT